MLLCLMGNSGAGKDTILQRVLDIAFLSERENIKQLLISTDRPPRKTEIDSEAVYSAYKPYLFLNKDEFEKFKSMHAFVEYRSYKVDQPNREYWDYGTFKLDLDIALKSNNVYLVTCVPSQFTAYYYHAAELGYTHHLYPIFIDVPSEKIRLFRMINRVVDDTDINALREVCRRFYNDDEYIDPSLVPARFMVCNDDIDYTSQCVLHLIDTFDPNCEGDDPWIDQSRNREEFGSLLIK